MRVLLLIGTIVSAFLTLSSQADASYRHLRHYYHRHVVHHHFGRYLATRHFRYHHRRHYVRHRSPVHVGGGGKPTCFYVAASMGGPCGCWAGWKVLGVVDHVWRGINLWLADDWRKFPHVEPAAANAAVWPGRHVAPVVPGSYDGRSVLVADSWATHRVRTAGLVFVRAPASQTRRHSISYSGPVPQ